MPESTSMALRMESSKDPQPTDALEERLSKAEKAVAIALDTFAYDELILVATEALKTRSQTLSKTVIKCRKNLLWARSHAYHHQNRYELALKDARAALKIDPDDVAAYIRAAALLFNTGHKEQAFSCLDTAQSLASKHGSATRALLLSRIDKQRRKVSGLSWRLIDRLPNEIFIEIASHLEIQDRSSMSQTCRAWRQILISVPSLWTSLTLITKHKEMGESKAVGWMRYIILRSERANHCLEYVSFKHAFPEKLLEKVCSVLRKSAASLKHIEIPTGHGELCYDRLYRHCPLLTFLVFKPRSDVLIPSSAVDACPAVPTFAATAAVEPFSLESLHVDSGRSRVRALLNKHLHYTRTLIGYNPFPAFDMGTSAETQMNLGLANHLEEWGLPHPILYHQRNASPLSLTFPRLTKLSGFCPQYGSQLQLTFPNLEDLQYYLSCMLVYSFDALAHVLTTSPKLRKLSFKEGGASEHRQDVRDALFNLRHLEELDMAEMSARDHDLTCGQLVPRPVSSESGQIELHVPLPNLRLLVVDGGSDTFLYKLAVCLLAREQVRLGDGLVTAMRLAQDRALPKSSPAAAVSPFQRGITSTSRRNEAKELGGPRLKHGSDCARLHLLKLAKVVALPDHLRATLEGVTDKLIIEYGRL